jgi:hypothetical protein
MSLSIPFWDKLISSPLSSTAHKNRSHPFSTPPSSSPHWTLLSSSLLFSAVNQIAVYRLPLQDSLSMMYVGSLISSSMTYQLLAHHSDPPNSSFSFSSPDFKTLYEIVSSPFVQSLTEIGYLHSANLIQTMYTELSHITDLSLPSTSLSHGPTLQRIQFKYQRLQQFVSPNSSISASSPSSSSPTHHRPPTAQRRNSREFYSGDWTIAEFFLFLPLVMIRYSETPQLSSTLQHLIASLSGTLKSCVTAGCLLLGRLLERCVVKKCSPYSAMKSLVLSDEPLLITPLSSPERQLLESALSEDFFLSLIEIYETLSCHPSYPKTIPHLSSVDPSSSSPPPPPPSLSNSTISQEFFDLRGMLILELIQNNRSGHYSLSRDLHTLSNKQKELWKECQQLSSSSFSSTPSLPAPPPAAAADLRDRLHETLRDLSSLSQSNLGTLLSLLFIFKTSQSFQEAILLNVQIGGEVHLRSPLCGAFYSASTYPMSSHDHHWSRQAIPPRWIHESLTEKKLEQVTEVMSKVCISPSLSLLLCHSTAHGVLPYVSPSLS